MGLKTRKPIAVSSAIRKNQIVARGVATQVGRPLAAASGDSVAILFKTILLDQRISTVSNMHALTIFVVVPIVMKIVVLYAHRAHVRIHKVALFLGRCVVIRVYAGSAPMRKFHIGNIDVTNQTGGTIRLPTFVYKRCPSHSLLNVATVLQLRGLDCMASGSGTRRWPN